MEASSPPPEQPKTKQTPYQELDVFLHQGTEQSSKLEDAVREEFALSDLMEGRGDVVETKRAVVVLLDRRLIQIDPKGESAEYKKEKQKYLEIVDMAERRGIVTHLSNKLNDEYGVTTISKEMIELFDGYHQKNLPMDFDTFDNAVRDEYKENPHFEKMVKTEPLVLQYLYSQITGNGKDLFEGMALEMAKDRLSHEYVINEKTIEICASLKSLYGVSSVVGTFLTDRGGTTDSQFSIHIPVTHSERKHFLDQIDNDPTHQLNIESEDFDALMGWIRNRKRLLGMQHGLAADKGVNRRPMGRLLADPIENQPRDIGIAFTSKGGNHTTLRKGEGIVSGHMDLAAVQIATGLQALGLVGKDLTHQHTHIKGHSMAGQEMFWLALYAQQGWNMSFESFTPVVTNSETFLTLYNHTWHGWVNNASNAVPMWIEGFNPPVAEIVGNVIGNVATKKLGRNSVGETIARYLIDSGEVANQEEIDEIVAIHVKNLKDYLYMQAGFRALKNDKRLDRPMLDMISRMYGKRFTAIWVATEDKILDPDEMEKILMNSLFRDKVRFLHRASHYAISSAHYKKINPVEIQWPSEEDRGGY